MIGDFQVWNKEKNQPATVNEINGLREKFGMSISAYEYPELIFKDQNEITHNFEICKV